MTEIRWEVGKTYKTRNGRDAIIYAIYPKQKYCILGAVFDNDEWVPDAWALNGAYYERNGDLDSALMPPEPETHVAWANIHTGSSLLCLHETREEAEDSATDGRTACIRIEWKDGQFDD